MEAVLLLNLGVAPMFTDFFFKPSFFFRFVSFLLFLFQIPLFGQVTFSEVMNNPATSEAHDEFIELYNTGPDSMDLSNWYIDDSLAVDEIRETGQGAVLAPGQYAIILDGSYFENSSTYDSIIPDSALILRIADKAFGRSGLSNSINRRLSLWSGDSVLISCYKYRATYPAGFSNEKMIMEGDNNSDNWNQSLKYGGTPGYRNSVSPYTIDLGFKSVNWKPSSLVLVDQQEEFTLIIANMGQLLFDGSTEIHLFADANRDSVFDNNDLEIYRETRNVKIEPKEELQIKFGYRFKSSAKYQLVAEQKAAKDQNAFNDKIYKRIKILDASANIQLSEIKFLTQSGEPEWIELYNGGNKKADLFGWALADKKDTVLVDSSVYILPGQWKVLTASLSIHDYYDLADSLIVLLPHFITLNNDQDVIYLLTPVGGWYEQVGYLENWLEGEEGRKPSLERIRYDTDARIQSNWGPSTDASGATPGSANSLQISGTLPKTGKLSITPNPFSPDGDGFEDHAFIQMELPTPTSRLRVEIFDLAGRLIRDLRENSFSGSENKLIWDGRNNAGSVVRMGIYIINAEIISDKNGLIQSIRMPIVVAGKL